MALAVRGHGLLYVRKDKIQKLWPIFGDNLIAGDVDNVMKLNHTGTHPVHTDLTIADAIAFHEMIGTKRKEARLRYLQTYWTGQVRGTKNVTLFTPADPWQRSWRHCQRRRQPRRANRPREDAARQVPHLVQWREQRRSDGGAHHTACITG